MMEERELVIEYTGQRDQEIIIYVMMIKQCPDIVLSDKGRVVLESVLRERER